MIRIKLAEEPISFQALVREPGLRAIAEMVGEKPPRRAGKRFKQIADFRQLIPSEVFPPYWTEILDDLMKEYNQICSYTCFRIHTVTGARSVDHFVAKSRRWDRVYEWNNYRLACARVNSRKNDFNDVLDPIQVHDDWFHLELVGFQVVPNPVLHPMTRKAIQDTICRLKLNDFRGERSADAEGYWDREIPLTRLLRESPFVAKELRRQNRLNKEDL